MSWKHSPEKRRNSTIRSYLQPNASQYDCISNIIVESKLEEYQLFSCDNKFYFQVELDRSVRSRNESEMKRSELNERLEEVMQALEDTRDRYRGCAQEV